MNKTKISTGRVWSVIVDLVWGSGGCVYRTTSLGATGGIPFGPLLPHALNLKIVLCLPDYWLVSIYCPMIAILALSLAGS